MMAIALFLMITSAASADDVADIKSMIEESYVKGAFNGLDPDAMRRGFHEDFAIFWAEGEQIGKYPIETWAANTEKQKADPEFDPADNVWSHEFAAVDVTEGPAMVKLELSHEGKHVYTDYLLLLKFESGWRIVSKVYTKH
jgi:hypothetical protein